ncbi:unnamed protein product [Rhodiola kirilowii]
MKCPSICFMRRPISVARVSLILLLCCLTIKINLCCFGTDSSIRELPLEGQLEFDDIHHAAKDFGNRYKFLPLAVLHPKSVSDIASMIHHICKWVRIQSSLLRLEAWSLPFMARHKHTEEL